MRICFDVLVDSAMAAIGSAANGLKRCFVGILAYIKGITNLYAGQTAALVFA